MNCPECDMPMIWSIWYERMVCSVYGRHINRREDWRHSPVAGVIHLDVRRHQRRAG